MERIPIIPGMTGTQFINALNSNYSAVFMNNIRRVGEGGYSSIQSAIDAASIGETVLVMPGTYTENIVLKAGVDLVSIGLTTINGTVQLGLPNPYISDITGTKTAYKDKSATNFNNYLAYNNLNSGNVNLSIKKITGNILVYGGYTLNITSSDLESITSYDQSHLHCVNSKISGRVNAMHGSVCEVIGGSIRYDKDIFPLTEIGDIYDETRWGNYGQGTHIIEPSSSYNKDLIATLILKQTTLDYMGDDVLNGLPVDVALANLAVNTTFKSDTITNPSTPTPIHEPWTTGHNYTAGEFVPYNNVLLYIVENHTSGNINTDWRAGRIRTLFGAKLQDNGYYCSLFYSTSIGAWQVAHRLGAYHGGKYRNRGCAIYNYHNSVNPCNLIFEDVTINDHSGSWSLTSNVNLTIDQEGKGMYGGGTTIQAGASYTYFNNVKYNYIGYWGEGADHYGIYINQNTQLDKEEHHLYNVTLMGKAINRGILVLITKQVGMLAGPNNKLHISNIKMSHGGPVTPSISQYFQGSNILLGTSAVLSPSNLETYQAYWNSYVELYDNKEGSSELLKNIV